MNKKYKETILKLLYMIHYENMQIAKMLSKKKDMKIIDGWHREFVDAYMRILR